MEKVSERIYLIEGEATWNPDAVPQVGDMADHVLKLNHEAENYAILVYGKIIEESLKHRDTKTRHRVEGIIKQEEDHYWTFDDFLR